MSNRFIRFFLFDFLDGQEKWLNRMAERGLRLKKCGVLTYTFEDCQPNEYEYVVAFVGDQSYSKAKQYRMFLENMGFRTFTKNMSLQLSYGKARWRPSAKGIGRIATSPGAINKELLILEKKRDGSPFELCTDVSDKLNAYKKIKRTYVWIVFMLLLLEAMILVNTSLSTAMTAGLSAVIIILIGLFLIPTVKYSSWIKRLKNESRIFE